MSNSKYPLIKGGQGRSDAQVERDADALMGIIVACVLGACAWGAGYLIVWVVDALLHIR